MSTNHPQTVLIAPIGDIDDDILPAVQAAITRVFDLPCRVEGLVTDIGFALNTERDQFHSTAILAELTGRRPDDIFKIVALTTQDLFIPILTHVYGEAELGGTSCIVSTCRLGAGIEPAVQRGDYLARIAKECLHELGHTFDLRHCKDNGCLMHYCRSIEDVDHKSDQLCRYCQVMKGDYLKKRIA